MILPGELDELVNEKGKMIFNARPHKLIIKKDKLVALELIETKIIKKNGKYKLTDVRGSNFSIKTDHIILAIGQKQELQILSSYKKKLKNAKEKYLITKNIFAAGDYALGASTLIDAIAHAKNTANKVDEFLMQRKILKTHQLY
jgi:NADPH-dependent glutamate synthase beta subunit-like oxidoreductase